MRKTFRGRGARPAEVVALAGLDLVAEDGQFVVVLGPSGSGKSTLLRCVAGLETPDAGAIRIKDRDATRLPPAERDVAMVFQDFALYPHLTTFENIAFGLRARGVRGDRLRTEAEAAAETLGLEAVLDRRPAELSGGERQRVALARAIVRHPHVFLMDEPLSNLDAELRVRARTELRALQRRLGVTTLYVTHDQTEAMAMADRVAVLRAGLVEQVAAPVELYRRPATVFVARFIGWPAMNVVPAPVLAAPKQGALAGIRAEHVRLVEPEGGRVRGVVDAVEATGPDALVHVTVDGHEVVTRAESVDVVAEGARVGLDFAPGDLYFFDAETEKALS